MKKQLVSFTIATSLLAGAHNAFASDQHPAEIKHKQYIGTGIGAVAGAIFAGPVGFIAGGLLGSLAGKHDAVNSIENEQSTSTTTADSPALTNQPSMQATDNNAKDTIVVAQAGGIESVIDNGIDHASGLKDILVSELNLDIFFLSGSTAVEAFYQPRLNAVAMFMDEMKDVDLYLDGYSDRRGDEVSNLALSNHRLASVRDALVQAGVDDSRIYINARGEQHFNSTPGDLEAYTFDRRVVIRFEQSAQVSTEPVALTDQDPTI